MKEGTSSCEDALEESNMKKIMTQQEDGKEVRIVFCTKN